MGDIVAAPYQDHGTWNRARVLGILGSGLVDLYYVDYGDNGELPRDQLRSMRSEYIYFKCSVGAFTVQFSTETFLLYTFRSDFLSLPFQAIECSLAGVQPAGECLCPNVRDREISSNIKT